MAGRMWREFRAALVLATLAAAVALSGTAAVALTASALGAARSPAADPATALALGIAALGSALLCLALLEVTGIAIRLLREGRRYPVRADARARWAVRVAATLIGLSAAQAPAFAAGGARSGVVASAQVVPGEARAHPDAARLPSTAPDPRWAPDDPEESEPPAIELLGSRSASPADTEQVVVRRGECLWDIVARHLGPSASAAEIAGEWPRWYAANRTRIGGDPDLIHPGMRLQVPRDRS